ncbi:MAG TPA: sigma-70 family RNA polymerase sigma factor [Verrucomicrobiae bacterium]|nr:sigma-70 family RNA polymerase sigma factor [Verrucomicrobiae bacterium]
MKALMAAPIDPAEDTSSELEQIFREHHGLVFRAAYRITANADDAEDVLQTVFLRLMKRDRNADPVGNMASFLHRAAVNAALDLMRARQNIRNVPLDNLEPVLAEPAHRSPDRVHTSGEVREWLRGALARLNPRIAEMFMLRFFDGKENPEIAKLMNTTPGTVAVTLSRTRDRLEKEYQAYLGGAA